MSSISRLVCFLLLWSFTTTVVSAKTTTEGLKLILNLFPADSDSNRCFAVLKYFSKEISTNGQNKALNLLNLAHTIEKENLNCNSRDVTFRVELLREIEIAAADVLVSFMKSGNFSSNEYVRVLLDALYDLSPKVFDTVMKRLIDGTSGAVEPRFVLANIFQRFSTPQAISGIDNLFLKIKDGGLINNSDIIMSIASNLSELRNRVDFGDLSTEIKTSFDKVVDSLPQCARNIFFMQSVCLYNNAKNMYLQAANDQFNYDKDRRRVLLTAAAASEDIPKGATWIPISQGDDILFRNRDYPNEFLYFADFDYNNELRFVFSWIPGFNRDNQSAFQIQLLDDESCNLKSTRYNEYMFASDVKFEKDDNSSYVFALKSGTTGGLDSAFAWQIRAC